MSLALADLEQSIENLKGQYIAMPEDFYPHITERLISRYKIYIDLLNTLISHQTGVNKLQRMVDDQTVKETQERQQLMLQEFKTKHNNEFQNEMDLISKKYDYTTGYCVEIYVTPDYTSDQEIASQMQNFMIDNISKMEKEFFESKKQSLQIEFDETLKKFTNELGAETTAIIEQCMKSTKFHEEQLIGYVTKLDIATQELIEYSS
jgi:hypothetical protein